MMLLCDNMYLPEEDIAEANLELAEIPPSSSPKFWWQQCPLLRKKHKRWSRCICHQAEALLHARKKVDKEGSPGRTPAPSLNVVDVVDLLGTQLSRPAHSPTQSPESTVAANPPWTLPSDPLSSSARKRELKQRRKLKHDPPTDLTSVRISIQPNRLHSLFMIQDNGVYSRLKQMRKADMEIYL